MTNYVYICGLNDWPSGPMNGQAAFGRMMTEKYGVNFIARSFADSSVTQRIVDLGPDTVVATHSNGGDLFLTETDGAIVKAGFTIKAYCSLDAKPRMTANPFSWARWALQSSYALPHSTYNVHAFYGTFGRGFKDDAQSTFMELPGPFGGHASFPGNIECQKWIENAIMEAVK